MLSFEEARARLLASVAPLGVERLPLALAAGRVAREPVRAPVPVPPFDGSAMDGYAVATSSFVGEGPWRLPVVGESRTGHAAPAFEPGAACRIFTGAVVPEGADAVVMQEAVTREETATGALVTFRERPARGAHVRPAGQDLAEGEEAVAAGTRLGPAHLSLLATLDRAEVVVGRRPRVAIVATGDELRAPGSMGRAGSIPESNGAGLAALAAQAGAEARVLPMVGDDLAATTAAIVDALEGSDVVLTVGGVSVGDHDVVRAALERAGVELAFWRVAIKPGKPIAVGRAPRAVVLGLPGNPVSALVTFSLFGAPLLRALQGDARPVPSPLRARLARRVERAPGRVEFVRATLEPRADGLRVTPLANQASGAIVALARCDALAVLPADAAVLDEGTWVDVVRPADL